MLTFKQFINEDKDSENKVNIIIGKFQPFTLGHMKMVDTLYEQNNLPTYIFSVRRKNPILSDNLTEKIFRELTKDKRKFYDFSFIDRYILSECVKILNQLDLGIALVGVGEDRGNALDKGLQIAYDKRVFYEEDTKIFVLKRDADDISATKLRLAILNDDTDYIKQSMPRSLFKFIPEIKKDLQK